MPIYEYICSKCRQEFEALVRGEEKPECPECGSKSLNKMLSVPSAPSQGGFSPPCGLSRPLPS